MYPTWLVMLSWTVLAMGLASSAVIVVDIYVRGYRQSVKIKEMIWSVTALYQGPAAVACYWTWGRPEALRWQQRCPNPPKRPRPPIGLVEGFHCGAHCTLGAIIASVAIFAVGIPLGSGPLWVDYIGDYLLAIIVGVMFRYLVAPGRGGRRVWAALMIVTKSDLLAVSAFELALFVWLTLVGYVIFSGSPLRAESSAFWFFIQVGLIGGFFAAWPVTVWLIHKGVKTGSPNPCQ